MQNLTALKAKIDTDILDESNVVLEDQQTNISELVDGKFEMFNLAPPPVTDRVDLSHISCLEERKMVDTLLSSYLKAFSTHRYDVGHFEFFEAELDCIPGSSVIERERQIKPSIVAELKPIKSMNYSRLELFVRLRIRARFCQTLMGSLAP